MIEGIWKTIPVDVEPQIGLENWVIYQTPEHPTRTRHFVGYHRGGREGRVSSAIQSFDVDKFRGITRSGRVYQLIGEPRYDADARYVWGRWCQINGIDPRDCEVIKNVGELR